MQLNNPAPRVSDVTVHHVTFEWQGWDLDCASVQLVLHAQYTANATVNRLIVQAIRRIVTATPSIAVFNKRWQDEEIRAGTAQFVKRKLRHDVRAADRLNDQGDLTLWIEIATPTLPALDIVDETSDAKPEHP